MIQCNLFGMARIQSGVIAAKQETFRLAGANPFKHLYQGLILSRETPQLGLEKEVSLMTLRKNNDNTSFYKRQPI